MTALCVYCDHPAHWHHHAHGCQHNHRMRGGSVCCDCDHYRPSCDVCDGHGCADCNT